MKIRHSLISLGLAISLAGSLLTIPLDKKYHRFFGMMLTGWAGVHSWQNRKGLVKNLHREVNGISGIFAGCANFFSQQKVMAFLSQHVKVLHYMPGRVRLYSQELLHNPNNVQQLTNYLHSIGEIHTFAINPDTGSVLIQYAPESAMSQPLLKEVENLVVRQWGRR